MIKNMICSKLLFVFLTLFCSLVVSVLFIGTTSFAYSFNGVEYDYMVNLNTFNYYSDYKLCGARNGSSGNYNLCTVYPSNTDGEYNLVQLTMVNYSHDTSYSHIYGTDNIKNGFGKWVKIDPSGVANWSINYSGSVFSSAGLEIFDSYADAYSYITTPNIDWNNPFYSANIPNPNMYVSYRNLSTTPVIDVPLNVSIASFPVGQNVTEYYVQMFALVNMDFNYYVQNTRDGIVYNGLDMEKWTTYFDVVTPQDYKKASDLSEDYIHLALTNGWYNNYPQDSSFNFSFADGIPSNLQSSAITKFHNFRKNATFADNTVYLYVRYFTIDEENNFVVGSWTVWKSYNPNEFYAELPSYYVPYNIVPGTQGISSNVTPVSTSSPEPSIIVNPVNTNPGVNITVTQNVPNYPDYPTIASYNKDNLLVDTINQLGSIQTFFGDFGMFLVTAFAFMPAWIWAIIGVGFSLSIFVMFLKIL